MADLVIGVVSNEIGRALRSSTPEFDASRQHQDGDHATSQDAVR